MYGQKFAGQSTLPQVINVPSGIPRISIAPSQTQQAITLHQQGKLQEAANLYQAVLRENPTQPECLHYFGLLLHQVGNHADALPLMLKAAALQKSNPAIYSNLSLIYLELKNIPAALECCERALALDRNFPDALNNRGNVLRELNRFEEALHSYTAALERRPGFLEAYANSGLINQTLGDHAEALRCFDKAIALQPSAFLYNARGCMLRELFKLPEALESFGRALELQADFIEAWINQAGAHFLQGEPQKASASLERALQIAPQSAELRLRRLIMRVPIILHRNDDVPAIRAAFAKDLADFTQWLADNNVPDPLEAVGCIQPFYLAYHELCNRELLTPYGAACAQLMQGWSSTQKLAPLSARRIRPHIIKVGVVSAHFLDHPVWNAFVKGWFRELDQSGFELHAFYLGLAEDAQTTYARTRASAFHSGAKTEAAWAELIVSSGIDVLIYPELGMDNLTIKLAAMRLAHVQLATWGHPETTALPTMDAYLSATGFEGAGADAHYVEKLFLLPGLGCYYEPEQVAQVDLAMADLGIGKDAILFICAGSPYKYAPKYDHVFVDIARRLKDAQFIFFKIQQLQSVGDQFHQRIAAAFRAAGLDPERHLRIVPWQAKPQFHSIMRKAAVYLDTIGFSGFNTAMQAVECGLPIVTVEGHFMRGRFASAILKQLGLPELVCKNSDDYVNTAVNLATNAALQANARETIQTNRKKLYTDASAIRAMEDVLRQLCGAPPARLATSSPWSKLKRLLGASSPSL